MTLLRVDDDAFTNDFPNRTFALKHELANHPLLTLPRIVDLIRELPRDRLEYNSGRAAISQDPNATPLIDLAPVEIVRQIETCGAWMVLKQIETVPAYRALVEETLMSVARARGFATLHEAGFDEIEGFIFVSSPHSTTPFHADSDENFFFQIHGEKRFYVFDNRDRWIASDEALEAVVAKHRNLPYDPRYDVRQTPYRLFPGDGIFVPYQWPHYVRTAASHSISLSVTWKSAQVRRLNDLHIVNSMLRGLGFPQAVPGQNAAFDSVKLALFRTASTAVEPLRKSEAMRKLLRGLVLGKNANYYYRDGAKKDAEKKAA
ncbi:MAG: cupin-like domain-containing protein [Pseudorhodoplanes sp.]|nr:cupin-like domain-containing protein [Pseudorhodoplanes sp.]